MPARRTTESPGRTRMAGFGAPPVWRASPRPGKGKTPGQRNRGCNSGHATTDSRGRWQAEHTATPPVQEGSKPGRKPEAWASKTGFQETGSQETWIGKTRHRRPESSHLWFAPRLPGLPVHSHQPRGEQEHGTGFRKHAHRFRRPLLDGRYDGSAGRSGYSSSQKDRFVDRAAEAAGRPSAELRISSQPPVS